MDQEDVNCPSTLNFDPSSCSGLHSQTVVSRERRGDSALPSSTGRALSEC